MSKCFKEVARVPVCVEKGKKYQVELVGNEVVISKEIVVPMWKDITKQCYLEFVDSHHCDGRYIAIFYNHQVKGVVTVIKVAVVGLAGIQAQHGFMVEKPDHAWTSFAISMKVRR